MITEDTTGWANSTGLTGKKVPTWDFLWKEIDEDEDVEIFFSWEMTVAGKTVTMAHAVTLTSLKFWDADGDGKWDSDATGEAKETAQVDYRDPNSPNDTLWNEVSLVNNQLVMKEYVYDKVKYDVSIYGAFSESHVPLPAALFAGGAMLALMGALRQRRRRG
jgi:hypothetical protein